MERIVVKSSPIHGQGVFAARRIEAGEGIIDWSECSEVLSDHAGKKHPVHLTIVARVAAGHAEAHQKASVPSLCGKDARCFRVRLDCRLTVDPRSVFLFLRHAPRLRVVAGSGAARMLP
jgi:hypothetical protein